MDNGEDYHKYLEDENVYERRYVIINEKREHVENWFRNNSLSILRFKGEQYVTENDCITNDSRFDDLERWTYVDRLSYIDHIGKLYFTWYLENIHFEDSIDITPGNDEEHAIYNDWFIKHWRITLLNNEISFSVDKDVRYISSTVLTENYKKRVSLLNKEEAESHRKKQLQSIDEFIRHTGIRHTVAETIFNCLKYENEYQLTERSYVDSMSLINIARLMDILEYKITLTGLAYERQKSLLQEINFNVYPFTDNQIRLLHKKLISSYINPLTPLTHFKHMILKKADQTNLIEWVYKEKDDAVNKIPLVQLISRIVGGTSKDVNNFIIRHFCTSIQNKKSTISREELNDSRKRITQRANQNSPLSDPEKEICDFLKQDLGIKTFTPPWED